jgi:hypothetical protein
MCHPVNSTCKVEPQLINMIKSKNLKVILLKIVVYHLPQNYKSARDWVEKQKSMRTYTVEFLRYTISRESVHLVRVQTLERK